MMNATKLSRILFFTLVIATDPAYPPQSEIGPAAARPLDTKCAIDQLTTGKLSGFDVQVASELAHRLDVEACFVTPDWFQVLSGNWGEQWDISIGSMAITLERMASLSFTQPYYTAPASFFVHADSTGYASSRDLAGKRIGTCGGCTYQSYLEGWLELPDQEIDFTVKETDVIDYATEALALQELAWGDGVRLDAVLIADPTGKEAITNGLPIKLLGAPVYTEYLAAAIEKNQAGDNTSFLRRINEIIQQMHADGTLRSLSMQYYGGDLTTKAAEFDLSMLK